MEEKIKDKYECDKLVGNDTLVMWYNQVIEKNIGELTISDVARCIRQKLFLDTAYEMLLVYLLHDPYAGDIYAGELMEKACEVDSDFIIKHKDSVSEIIEHAQQFIDNHTWEFEEDKIEYQEAVERLSKLIK
ncbi:MAG: contact-dependent growth inhibition system immunity protein [Eubacteriales bacterium]|nr:contact-dependent growth inhibition system immunity protein [Eubacteriales bacterium]